MKNNHGGRRPGAGRKTAEEKGIEKRKAFNILLSPSVAHAFHRKHRRNWGRRVEDFMKEDLSIKENAK